MLLLPDITIQIMYIQEQIADTYLHRIIDGILQTRSNDHDFLPSAVVCNTIVRINVGLETLPFW